MVPYFRSRQLRIALWVCLCIAVAVSVCTVALVLQYSSREFVVRHTERGFEPGVVRIPMGATVVFVNEADTASWPASDVHPTHAGYPVRDSSNCLGFSFDACKALAQGEQWSFRFAELGDWRYHDHLAPSMGGTVEVVNIQSYFWSHFFGDTKKVKKMETVDLTLAQLFAGDDVERGAHMRAYASRDPEAAWNLVKQAAQSSERPRSLDVHQLGHVVGTEIYRTRGWDGFLLCDDALTYACSHGFIEAAVRERGASAVLDIAHTCEAAMQSRDVSDEHTKFPRNCFHGIGHGLASLNGLKLRPSLDACGQLFAEERALRNCQFGVFMEYYMSSPMDEYVPHDPWALCSSLPLEMQYACSDAMPSMSARFSGESAVIDVRDLCVQAPTEVLQRACVFRAGRVLAGDSLQDTEKAIALCAGFPTSVRDDCLFAGALERSTLLSAQTIHDRAVQADRLCDATDEELREHCKAAVRDTTQLNFQLYAAWREYPL